jgi:PAS domain S-box-containing protein
MTSSAEGRTTSSIFRRPGVAYAVAIGLTAVAAVVRVSLEPMWGARAPYVLFVLAVLISGRYGGLGPGLLSTGVAAIAAAYLLVEPAYVWGLRYPADLLGWTVFVGVGVAISITNESWRRQMRREADAREQAATTSRQLEIAIESGRMGTWEYDVARGQVRWSAALEAIHGHAPGTFPGTIEAFRQEILEEDRERVMAAIATSAQGNAEHHIEYRIVRRDGAVRWVEGRGQLFRDANGKSHRMVGVCVDVTDRMQADERFRMAVEAAPAAILMVDGDGMIVMVNAMTEHLLGYERGELVGSPVDRLVPLRSRGTHSGHRESFMGDVQRRPMGAGRDLFALRKDGTEVPVEIGLSPIRMAEGNYILAAVTDITGRKKAAEKEREAMRKADELNRMKDQFLATLSHELRTPINSILGYAQLLTLETMPPDRIRHAYEAIERNATSQARLIESLLDLSRLQSGKFELRKAPLELSTVVSRAVDVVGPAANAKGIRLLFTPPSAGIHLDGDADRLQQVVWNLLSNAVKFTPSGGQIEVRLSETDSVAQIDITDTGGGISADFMSHLFERFRQAESATSSGGLGIGLALVRELVEAHGGTVAASSPGHGLGSTFTIALPLRIAHGGLAPASSSDPHVADRSPTALS